jgi:cob(I)alamin adenosyltransferase
MIIVFTGNGKGKTSATIGITFRASISNKKIGYIQFMKPANNDASKLPEILKNVDFFGFGTNAFVDPNSPTQEAKNEAEKGWIKAKEFIKNKDLIVLDELNIAIHFGLLNPKEIVEILKPFAMPKADKPKNYIWPIIIVTGRFALKEIIEIADLVTEMKEEKHPYNKGYLATKGIDF